MSRTVLLASLMAVNALAADFAPPYEYVGCVRADPGQFPVHPTFVKAFTPQQCQEACKGKANLVALGDGCHCDDPSQANELEYVKVEEEACSTLCVPEDKEAGYCGGGKDGTRQIYNLYRATKVDPDNGGKKDPADEDCDCEDEKKHEEVVVVEGSPPEVVDCPTRENWNGTIPDHHSKPAECEDCEKPHEIKIVCICPEGCGSIEHGEACPPEGCPPDNNTKVVCQIPEGCGSIKHGEACPTEGCPEPAGNGSKKPVAPVATPHVCPPEGCPSDNTKPADNGGKPKPADTGDKSKACPPEGCPEDKAADSSKPAETPACPPEGCPKDQNGEKPAVIVSSGVKFYVSTVVAGAAVFVLFGFA
ncbi:Fc.00g011950.m01.CDS01 [Cosmosporella sp. VM-42]